MQALQVYLGLGIFLGLIFLLRIKIILPMYCFCAKSLARFHYWLPNFTHIGYTIGQEVESTLNSLFVPTFPYPLDQTMVDWLYTANGWHVTVLGKVTHDHIIIESQYFDRRGGIEANYTSRGVIICFFTLQWRENSVIDTLLDYGLDIG